MYNVGKRFKPSPCAMLHLLSGVQDLALIRFGGPQGFSVCARFPSLVRKCKILWSQWKHKLETSLEGRRGKPDSLLWTLNSMGLSSYDTPAAGTSHSPAAQTTSLQSLVQSNHQVRSSMQWQSTAFVPLDLHCCQK